MQEATNPIVNWIKLYESYIEKGNAILRRYYKTSECPLLAKRKNIIPQKGSIEPGHFKFYFRGIGCRFEFGPLVVDFDYTLVTLSIKVLKLLNFICSLKATYLPKKE